VPLKRPPPVPALSIGSSRTVVPKLSTRAAAGRPPGRGATSLAGGHNSLRFHVRPDGVCLRVPARPQLPDCTPGRQRPAHRTLRFCASILARPGGERCVGAHDSVPGSPHALACLSPPRRRSVMTSKASIARSRTASLSSPRRNGPSPSRRKARPAPPARSRPARTRSSRPPVRWRRGRRPRRGTDESPEPGLRRTPEDRPAQIAADVIKTPHSDRKSSHCGTSTRDRKGTHHDGWDAGMDL